MFFKINRKLKWFTSRKRFLFSHFIILKIIRFYQNKTIEILKVKLNRVEPDEENKIHSLRIKSKPKSGDIISKSISN